MRLPRKVRVGPFVYRVSDDLTDLLRACRANSTDLLGHCDMQHLRILVEPDQATGSKRDTLLHEVLHTVTNAAGLADEWGGEKDEAVVRRMTPILLAVIRDNPKVIDFLRAGAA